MMMHGLANFKNGTQYRCNLYLKYFEIKGKDDNIAFFMWINIKNS
jgi:hypothetical protein